MAVLGVIENQVSHAQFMGQSSGIAGGAVVLAVGVEHLTVAIQTESLAHEPLCAFHKTSALLVEWFVA